MCLGNLPSQPFRNLLLFPNPYHTQIGTMAILPQSYANWRSPRARLADVTPAVLRLPDGRRHRGELESVSLTGGLLSMPAMLDQGSRIKLMFVTNTGPVAAAAEMLPPVSATRQPFRFVDLQEGDQTRLRTVVQTSLDLGEEAWIEKYRAALLHQNPARHRVLKMVATALSLLTVVGSAIYFLHRIHLLK